MSAHMKKHLTNEVIDLDSYSSEEVHGKWLNSPRMRVAKLLNVKSKMLDEEQIEKKLKAS